MAAYSDLAIDCIEADKEINSDEISSTTKTINGINVKLVTIKSDGASERFGKEKGDYYTIEGLNLTSAAANTEETANVVAEVIKAIIRTKSFNSAVVFGLGNRNITPDALGPAVIENMLVTRHIDEELAKSLSLPPLFPVAAVALGVLGQTGIETAQTAKAICDSITPSCAIVIDALAASSLKRLATTIQIASTGLSPGSGVKNARASLCAETLSIPVVSIGVPLVADISSVEENPIKSENPLIVTPRNIDILIEHSAKVIAAGINIALQKDLSYEDILALT